MISETVRHVSYVSTKRILRLGCNSSLAAFSDGFNEFVCESDDFRANPR